MVFILFNKCQKKNKEDRLFSPNSADKKFAFGGKQSIGNLAGLLTPKRLAQVKEKEALKNLIYPENRELVDLNVKKY